MAAGHRWGSSPRWAPQPALLSSQPAGRGRPGFVAVEHFAQLGQPQELHQVTKRFSRLKTGARGVVPGRICMQVGQRGANGEAQKC